MQKLLLIFLSFAPCLLTSQTTYVPDDVFEDYLETFHPACNNGVAGDNLVLTEGMELISMLDFSLPNNIADFTGIEACGNLSILSITGNSAVTSLDLSGITSAGALNSYLLLTLSSCPNLTSLILPSTQVSVAECSFNSQLSSIIGESGCILSGLNRFQILNSLTEIDFSTASVSAGASLILNYNPQLSCLRLDNGDCFNWGGVFIEENVSLDCVQVDDPDYSAIASSWVWVENNIEIYDYSTNCNCGSVGIDEGVLSHERDVVAIYDLLGRETVFQHNVPLIYLYYDGTREKRVTWRP